MITKKFFITPKDSSEDIIKKIDEILISGFGITIKQITDSEDVSEFEIKIIASK